jgi:pimeloyl-ACP methyl ester carboxylesterase
MTVTVETADGRTLEVLISGPDDGLPLLFHWGTPQGAVPFGILERPAAARNLRVVSYSRPGYGMSSPRRDAAATVADDVADAAAVLDRLGLGGFVTLGWSGGGPRALACAALLPGRCLAAASGAGVAPVGVQGLEFVAGMGPENIDEFEAAMAGAEALEEWLSIEGPSTLAATADDVIASFGQLLSEIDKAALTGELAECTAESLRRAGQQGIAGWRDDDLTLVRPWGFDLTAIEVPVSIWQGGQDKMVPYAHGAWLAAHTPGARAHLYDSEGHISIIMQMDRILDDLLDGAGREGQGGGGWVR